MDYAKPKPKKLVATVVVTEHEDGEAAADVVSAIVVLAVLLALVVGTLYLVGRKR